MTAGGEPPLLALRPGDDLGRVTARADLVQLPGGAAFERALAGALALLPRLGGATLVPGGGDALLGEPGGLRTCYPRAESVRPLSPAAELAVALRRGDLQVTNGPLLTVSANGAGPGQTASAPDGKVRVSLRAQAAPYVDLSELSVLVITRGGLREAQRLPVKAATAPLRHQAEVTLPVTEDAAIVVVARGARPLMQAGGPRPFAVSAPVYVDRNGDGKVFVK